MPYKICRVLADGQPEVVMVNEQGSLVITLPTVTKALWLSWIKSDTAGIGWGAWGWNSIMWKAAVNLRGGPFWGTPFM